MQDQETDIAPDLAETLENLPAGPGVYLMADEHGEIIYVGKAASLKKRVWSYFRSPAFRSPAAKDRKTTALVARIRSLSTISTVSEKEALILEHNLIKQHRPRYNVLLKDGKRFPLLRIDTREDYPVIEVVRRVKKDGALYFGPYAAAMAARETLRTIHTTFPLRRCKGPLKTRSRPCLNFQMGRCLAPCAGMVTREGYREMVDEAVSFLSGKTTELLENVRRKMNDAAEREDFEQAAALRDRMYAITKTLEKQAAVTTDFQDRDAVAIAVKHDAFAIAVLFIRAGQITGGRDYFFEMPAEPEEALSSFLRQFYESDRSVPGEILVSRKLPDLGLLSELLSELAGNKVSVLCPVRGDRARVMAIARQNAEDALLRRIEEKGAQKELLVKLSRRLLMDRLPSRIECVDISHTRGSQTVASLVRFENARPEKSGYRHYRLSSRADSDDYAAMREVLTRRFAKAQEEGLPDLLMVDGGKGQLAVAMAVLQEMNLVGALATAGIAKKDPARRETSDKIFIPGRANPIIFGRDQDALLLLCRVRDEAHRFAVSFHRKKRGENAIRSELDHIPGIGPKRRQALLKAFGDVASLRRASGEEIASRTGLSLAAARAVLQALAGNGEGIGTP
ncbi:MAG: excinuclease ABC subunit UvrC [Thermodesulfobacteriota bacterium]